MISKIDKFFLGLDLMKIKITKKYKPLIVSWQITSRCNQYCKYCTDKIRYHELITKQCFNIINVLKKRGTKLLTITGGEPTLRKDLSLILRYAKKKNIFLFLNTNGIKLNKDLISFVDRVSLSLDGPKKINDKLRGKNSYKTTIKAIKLCKKNNVLVLLTSVINKQNINYIDKLLKIGQYYKVKIMFQPMRAKITTDYYIKSLLPTNKEITKAIKFLIKEKRKNNNHIGNSLRGLKHFLTYPFGESIGCISGKIFLRILPEGNIISCIDPPSEEKIRIEEIDNKGFKNLLNRPNCNNCYCANLVELNNLYNLEFSAILNMINY